MIKGIRLGFFTLLHPFEGILRLKQLRRGKFLTGLVFVLAYFLSQVFSIQVTSFSFVANAGEQMDIVLVFCVSVIPAVVFSIANWCFCTLTEGEAHLSEIWTTVGYALLPLILFNILLAILSRGLSLDESVIFTFINLIKNVWFVVYLVVVIMTVQQYSLGKTLFSMGLTIVGMAVILFLFLLIFSLFQQLFIFIRTIYSELSFRR